ncbi:unnamed protein product [Rhizoctonia solani]|uniref:Uncharacterized protein n=1 Tax=Rhizoctonia solani TaxID=456999 RepID=A0A8H3DRQ7_9AGAM|nr:unnamed protein product [Rhizoctonia solani]CAE6533256.1 unnamed protein product [Rhizoctonia solani]
MPVYPFVPALDAIAEAEARWLRVLLGRPNRGSSRVLERLHRELCAVNVTPCFRSPPSDRFEVHELNLLKPVLHYRLSDSSRPRFLVAQLFLALHGGQILLTLFCIERPLTARILIAFRNINISDCISIFKLGRNGLSNVNKQGLTKEYKAIFKMIQTTIDAQLCGETGAVPRQDISKTAIQNTKAKQQDWVLRELNIRRDR